MSLFLYEVAATQIRDLIQANLQGALDAVATVQTDGIVPLRDAYRYYLYEEANPEKYPACYILTDSFDYRLADKKANHINALGRIRVGMILEDYKSDRLQLAAYRNAAALHKVLNGAQLDYTFGMAGVTVRNIIKVVNTSFSEVFKNDANQGQDSAYRKEFVHNLEVEHYEASSAST